MSKLKNMPMIYIKVDQIKYIKYLIKNCFAAKKDYILDKSKEDAVNIKNMGYVRNYIIIKSINLCNHTCYGLFIWFR